MRKFFTHLDAIVPMHHPRVLIETAVAQGADRRALLEGSGLTEATLASPEARISYAQFHLLVGDAMRLTQNPALGIDVGRRTQVPQMGMLGLALVSSPTMGEALAAGLRHYHTIAPAWDLGVRIEGKSAILKIEETIKRGLHLPFATEWLVTAYDTFGRAMYGRPLPISKLSFSYPRPAYAARYTEVYDVPLLFDQPATEVEFEAAVLTAKVASADPATAKLAEEYCAQLAPTAVPASGLVAQVRNRLGSARGPLPDVDELARELQTSGRSLRRFLQQAGTSYQELADESRRSRALEWVRATDLTFEQIASQLGFSDVRSFRRAFKRWTGRTPNHDRDAARGG